MKIMQTVILFLSLFVMLAGVAIPIWWAPAQPIIASIPLYLANVVKDMTVLLDRVLDSLNSF